MSGGDVTETSDAYDRGHIAGEISQRLSQHDDHLVAINGSVGDTAKALDRLTMTVHRLPGAPVAALAGGAGRRGVWRAVGLGEADEARQQKSGERWSPLTRLGIAAGIVASSLGALALILSHFH